MCHQCYVCSPDDGKAEDLAQLTKFFPNTEVTELSNWSYFLSSSDWLTFVLE